MVGPRICILGSIEAIKGEEIYHLTAKHVIGIDNRTHLAVDVARQCGKFKIECQFRLAHITRYLKQRPDRDARPGQILVGIKRDIEVAEISSRLIRRSDIKLCSIRVAMERYRAARVYGKIFHYNLLQREIVSPPVKRISAEKLHVIVTARISHTHVTRTPRPYTVTCYRVHNQRHLNIGIGINGYVDVEIRRAFIVRNPGRKQTLDTFHRVQTERVGLL